MILKHNKKQNILAILIAFFAAAPILCLPLGVVANINPAKVVRNHAQSAGLEVEDYQEDDVIIEDWSLVGDISQFTDADDMDVAVEPENQVQTMSASKYSDVPKFIVYQTFDNANNPQELLDPQFFAADNTQFYSRKNAALKSEPKNSAKTVSDLHLGQAVVRTGIGDTWSKVKTEDGTEGYLMTDAIQDTMVEVDIDRTVWVDTDSLTVRAKPSTSSEKVTVVNDEDRLVCSKIVGDKWYKVTTPDGQTGYVYMSYTTKTPPPTPTPTATPVPPAEDNRTDNQNNGNNANSNANRNNNNNNNGNNNRNQSNSSKTKTPETHHYGNVNKLPKITGKNGESIVAIAKSMLGVKYRLCHASRSATDCSGLVKYCYAQIGYRVPHGATQIYKHTGVEVKRSEMKAGDVICYDGGKNRSCHVAIYIGGGQVIHASSSRGKVCYGNPDMMRIKAIKRIIR